MEHHYDFVLELKNSDEVQTLHIALEKLCPKGHDDLYERVSILSRYAYSLHETNKLRALYRQKTGSDPDALR